MRGCFYTEYAIIELGVSAWDEILTCFISDKNGKFDTVQTITKINKEKLLRVNLDKFPSGNKDFKNAYLSLIRTLVENEKVLIVRDFIPDKKKNDIVRYLNLGKSLKEAKELVYG